MPPPQRSSLRAGAVLGAGVLLLHELRYLVTWGGGAGRALADEGHAYLGYVTPLAVGLVAAAAAELVLRLGHRRERPPGPPRWTRAWLGGSAALLAIYVGQETIEGLIASGHPDGVIGVFGHGGLAAVPLALLVGGLITLAERGADAVLAAPSRLGVAGTVSLGRLPADLGGGASRPGVGGPAAAELALHLAGRAPPHCPR